MTDLYCSLPWINDVFTYTTSYYDYYDDNCYQLLNLLCCLPLYLRDDGDPVIIAFEVHPI